MLLNCGVGETLESPLDCKEIQPVLSEGDQPWDYLEGMMLKLKLQYSGHLMRRADSLEKTLMLGGIGPRIALQAMQEKKALSWRGRGRLRGFLELRRPWGFSPEARRGSQGASRAAPGIHACFSLSSVQFSSVQLLNRDSL